MIDQIWQYKIQFVPVILTLLIYEIPAIIRRTRKLFYVPIYEKYLLNTAQLCWADENRFAKR